MHTAHAVAFADQQCIGHAGGLEANASTWPLPNGFRGNRAGAGCPRCALAAGTASPTIAISQCQRNG
eukprot:4814874-Pyramimonas_sp.AAC.2